MIEKPSIQDPLPNDPDGSPRACIKVLGVEYLHLPLETGDLYVTADGLPFLKLLDPSNYWLDKSWFETHSQRLSGTSSIYKIRTKEVEGRSKDIIMKWNRMGQDIPGAEELDVLEGAAFNSPFEEFSLLMELRAQLYRTGHRVIVQKPLAIFVASGSVEMWQSGRKQHKMQQKLRTHNEVTLEVNRLYAVVYEWIKGIDAHQAFSKGIISRENMKGLALDAQQVMFNAGFKVRDNKPDHIIVRPRSDRHLARTRQGETLYALVDFELLERTLSNEEMVRQAKRQDYLKRQRDRFKVPLKDNPYPHLHQVNHLGNMPHAPLAPGPDLRAHILHRRHALGLEPARKGQVELRRIDGDFALRFVESERFQVGGGILQSRGGLELA